MAEQNKPQSEQPKADPGEQTKIVKPGEANPEAPKGGAAQPAGESSNPLVHQALAELDIAERNRAELDVEEADVKKADEEIAAAKKKLKDLGVTV